MLSRFFLFVALVCSLSCGSVKPTPDQFLNAVVDCSTVNPANPEASAAIFACLASAVAGNPAACLAGLLAGGQWTAAEIACVVRRFGSDANQKALNGSASPGDLAVADAARNWIRSENLGYR
jgi:hypothetical protein